MTVDDRTRASGEVIDERLNRGRVVRVVPAVQDVRRNVLGDLDQRAVRAEDELELVAQVFALEVRFAQQDVGQRAVAKVEYLEQLVVTAGAACSKGSHRVRL